MEIPYMRCVILCIPDWQQQGWCKSKKQTRVVRNPQERNAGTKGEKSKQDLASAKDLTIDLSEGHESLYHRFRLTN